MSEPNRADFEFLAKAAAACVENATSLAHEASSLLKQGYAARALALAITSLEEQGKQVLILRQKEEFDPEFREALSPAHRGHETMRHAPKQQQALQSIQNVFGGIPFLDSILGQKAVAPEFAQLAANLSERIGRDRERALYVEFPDGTVQRPLATITVDEARLYVGLALLQAKSSQWLATTPTEIIADYLEGYRAVWLENSGDAAGEDLATAVAQYERTHEYIVQRFKFVTDDDGWLLRLEKV